MKKIDTALLKQIKPQLILSITVSALLIIMKAFYSIIIDIISVFLFAPLSMVVSFMFLAAAIVSLVVAIRKYKALGSVSLIPLAIQLVSVVIVIYVPFTYIWIKSYHHIYKSDREKIVRKIESGELGGHSGARSRLIRLGDDHPYVSMGGNDIVVEERDGRKFVFFFTFRGILDNYSGLLYVPPGGDPKDYDKHEEIMQIISLGDDWYYFAHR